jgi:hypothetical protein
MTAHFPPDRFDCARPPDSAAPERFRAANAGAAVFIRQKSGGHAMLAVAPRRIVLTVAGSIGSEHIVGVLRDAEVAARLGSDAFHALINLADYSASVDWQDIQAIREVMPKGASRSNKNAYVVRNSFYAMVAKITGVMFPQTECAAFTRESEARAWLGWN